MAFLISSVLLLIAVRTDLRTGRISNRLIAAGAAAGIGRWAAAPTANGMLDQLAGFFLPIVCCWILFRMHALGAGDIKLLAVIGGLNGTAVVGNTMLAAFFIGAGYAAFILWRKQEMYSAFTDLLQYAKQLWLSKKVSPYPGRRKAHRIMHFSAAIFLGYEITMAGVKIWAFII